MEYQIDVTYEGEPDASTKTFKDYEANDAYVYFFKQLQEISMGASVAGGRQSARGVLRHSRMRFMLSRVPRIERVDCPQETGPQGEKKQGLREQENKHSNS